MQDGYYKKTLNERIVIMHTQPMNQVDSIQPKESNDPNDDRRITRVLLQYWETARGNRNCPSEQDIKVEELAAIWDSCFLVRRQESAERPFSYLYLGKQLIEAYGDDLQEREICERLVFPSSMSLVDKFEEVVGNGEPISEEASFVNLKGMTILYRSILLPLSGESGGIDFVIGGMRWKISHA